MLLNLATSYGMNLWNRHIFDGLEKREQYGYWDARLKEGFHFEPIRQIARQRLEHARRMAALLMEEMKEDRAV